MILLQQIQNSSVYRKLTLFLSLFTKVIKKKVNYWSAWTHPLRTVLYPDWDCYGVSAG